MEVRHTNIPDEAYENIADGWVEDYYYALKELFDLEDSHPIRLVFF